MSTLSVVICAKNESQWLPEQLLAIQTQGIVPDELILIDDGSTDDTGKIMRQFKAAARSICVRLIVQDHSIGAVAAYNRGVQTSTGDHIYCASANDVMQPGAIAVIAQALQMWPGAPIVTGDLKGLSLGWSDNLLPGHISRENFADLLGWPNITHGAACVVSRKAWDSVGGWQTDVNAYADALMWPILAARHGIVYTPHPIAWVRPSLTGDNYGSIALDHEKRRPYLEIFAQHILALEEPARSRLIESRMWDTVREFAPEMRGILQAEMVISK